MLKLTAPTVVAQVRSFFAFLRRAIGFDHGGNHVGVVLDALKANLTIVLLVSLVVGDQTTGVILVDTLEYLLIALGG
jgi:hypothetical protein